MRSSKERIVRKRLADGSIKEYRYAVRKNPEPTDGESFGALLKAFRRSPEFRALRPSSQRNYEIMIRYLEVLAPYKARAITRRNILNLRDTLSMQNGPGVAAQTMRVMSRIMSWAVDREWLESSPANRIRAAKATPYAAWTEAEADHAEASFPEHMRRLVILARYTGQRRSDLVAMTWAAYDGQTIRIVQQKTGTALSIPAHPRLRSELDRWKRDATSTHILTGATGAPRTPASTTQAMRSLCRQFGMRPQLTVHGLRKLAATALADSGCTAHEIAAITGHKTLGMVAHYTASANQQALATSAISKLPVSTGFTNARKLSNN